MRSRRAALGLVASLLLRPLPAQAQCPSGDISDVMRDPVVRDALDRAWRDTHEGQPDEHEEGGDIYQCRDTNGDGSYSYRTVTVPWPPGTSDTVDPGARVPPPGDCRLVANYHTHPGAAREDGYDNDRPSSGDLLGSAEDGVPGIIRYGNDGDTHDFSYGYNDMSRPRDPGWDCPRDGSSRSGSSVGDPHVRSLDGRRFDFQAIGDFVLMRTARGDLEIQVRQQPYRDKRHVSLNAGLVVRDGGDRIEWALGQPDPLLNGKPRPMAVGEQIRLRSHATLGNGPDGFVLVTAVGDRIAAALNGPYLDVRVSLAAHRAGKVSGLLGNFDGDPDNDLASADGRLINLPKPREPVDYTHPLYAIFGEGWRVPPDRLLFASPFSPAASGADPKVFPARQPGVSAAALTAAGDRCAGQGVTDDFAREACAFDVAVTEDPAFIASSLKLSRAEAQHPPLPATGGPIAADREVTGVLTRQDQRVEYSIDLPRAVYVFDARGSSGTWWTLMSPDKKAPFDSNQSAYMGDYPVRLDLARAGPYSITVGVQPQKGTGRYRFRVRSVPQIPAREIALGEEVAGRIAAIGEEHLFTLALPAGTYTFDVLAADNTSWTLTSPNGKTPFDGNQQEYMNSVKNLALPAGSYTLKVRGRAIVGVGSYRIKVSKNNVKG